MGPVEPSRVLALRIALRAWLTTPVLTFAAVCVGAPMTRAVTLTDGELATLPLAATVAGPLVVAFIALGALGVWRALLSNAEFIGAALVMAICAPLLAMIVVHVFNARWDPSPAVTRELPIVSVQVDRYYATPDCEVGVGAWRPSAEGFTFMLIDDDCRGLQAGTSRARVTTRAGAFGLEWVPSAEVLRTASAFDHPAGESGR